MCTAARQEPTAAAAVPRGSCAHASGGSVMMVGMTTTAERQRQARQRGMRAERHTLRLYEGSRMVQQLDLNIDPRDEEFLRETLERLVTENKGHLRVDLSRWRLDVHRLGGGMRKARCTVDRAGRTVVTH